MKKKYADWSEDYPNYLVLTHAGLYYMAWGRSAEVLNEVLDYKLAYTKKNNVPYTGGPNLDRIIEALNANHINYLVVEYGKIAEKREFEYCDEVFYRSEDFSSSSKAKKEDAFTDEEKLQAIDALINGVDPITGEILEEDHLINEDIVKALLLTAQTAITKRQERENSKKPSAGARWTDEEDQQLVEEYRNKMPIKEIAEKHERSESSIRSRIIKLALVEL